MTCFIECWKCNRKIDCQKKKQYYFVEMFFYRFEYQGGNRPQERFKQEVFICPECVYDSMKKGLIKDDILFRELNQLKE